MTFLSENLRDWRRVDPNVMLEDIKLKRSGQIAPPGRWIFREGISPLDLYAYLKARFGNPNGFQMALKSPSSDNLVHWHWSLQCHDHIIEFMEYGLHAAAYVNGLPQPTEIEQAELVAAIKADFAAHGRAMSVVKKSLEKWVLFVNPYHRLRRVVDQFSSRLRALELKATTLPEVPTTHEEAQELIDGLKACEPVYTEARGLGLALRMNAPVLAECFINLLLFLLAKPEIKQNERLYQDIIRTQIHERIRDLHLNCEGFTSPIDVSAKSFKDFHTLMNRRNDFLHGNVDPYRLKYDAVRFDGTIPLPDRYQNFPQLALINSLIGVEPESALGDVDIVNQFIEFVLKHLHNSAKQVVETFMDTSNPGWREDTKRPGILFPQHIAYMVLHSVQPSTE